MTTYLRDKYGRPYASLEQCPNGDIIGKDHCGRIVASYRASSNTTHEGYFGRIVGYGNTVACFFSP